MRLELPTVSSSAHYRSNQVTGSVIAIQGPIIVAKTPYAELGEMCSIERSHRPTLSAQVVSFEHDLVKLFPFEEPTALAPGAKVTFHGNELSIPVSKHLLGSVVDAFGNLLEGQKGEAIDSGSRTVPIRRAPPPALKRPLIREQFETGIRGIDALTPLAYGQRIGLFAGPGVGKSTLLGAIAKNALVDVVVIALVGERGREVGEFIEDCLGVEGKKRSVVVIATSDESPLRRSMAPLTATSIAEYFRSQGKRVLLLIDSLTRTARAVRDLGLACGEIPVRHGYTPSVYTELPRLLERAGNDAHGSITAIYTLLTNSENDADPLSEEVKSLLDGHLLLDETLAHAGVRPAIDYARSISRLAQRVSSPEQQQHARVLKKLLARLRKDREVLLFGGQADPELSIALTYEPEINAFLSQLTNIRVPLAQSVDALAKLAQTLTSHLNEASQACL